MDIVLFIFLSIFFLCWGSFLNVLGFRLVRTHSWLHPSRSYCPACHGTIAWYDLVPVISWFWLRGVCRSCKSSISSLYPFIEMLTFVVLCSAYCLLPSYYFWIYFPFISALIVIVRSDLETMLISQYTTLFLIPFAWSMAFCNMLPISWSTSMVGTATGYGFLYIVALLHRKATGIVGLGQGDVEMLGMIGAFLGPIGWWITVTLASFIGSLTGLCYCLWQSKGKNLKIPFGPFLALGAFLYLLYNSYICTLN